jgi:putative addiction module component (TIGR02574 family)
MAKSIIESLINDIMKLPPIQRIEIVEKILKSFEYEGRSEIDDLWNDEVEKRIDDYESGKIKSKRL